MTRTCIHVAPIMLIFLTFLASCALGEGEAGHRKTLSDFLGRVDDVRPLATKIQETVPTADLVAFAVEVLQDQTENWSEFQVFNALGLLRLKDAVEWDDIRDAVTPYLHHESPSFRRNAARTTAEHARDEAVLLLFVHLSDDDRRTRQNAVELLIKLGDEKVTRALVVWLDLQTKLDAHREEPRVTEGIRDLIRAGQVNEP